jgi:hypothetical protein
LLPTDLTSDPTVSGSRGRENPDHVVQDSWIEGQVERSGQLRTSDSRKLAELLVMSLVDQVGRRSTPPDADELLPISRRLGLPGHRGARRLGKLTPHPIDRFVQQLDGPADRPTRTRLLFTASMLNTTRTARAVHINLITHDPSGSRQYPLE